jgi:NAD+--dinitrogen-reductase ADP-D-ribosyltransferase
MNTYKQNVDIFSQVIPVPSYAQQTLNHCNLPAALLGSLQFQYHPTALFLDGVRELHGQLFTALETLASPPQRAQQFMDYMVVQFRLHHLEDAGLDNSARSKRVKADYLRMLRGWLFDPNGREAAVLKGWVESRFGLLPRYHHGPLHDAESETYRAYLNARAKGLLGTNALEAQLDLLYSYCQYELARQYAPQQHLLLYRGTNQFEGYDVLKQVDKHHAVVLLNNLNSFTADRERADEFGDLLLEVEIPWQKILYHSKLLPATLEGEDEYLVIGGVYQVQSTLW